MKYRLKLEDELFLLQAFFNAIPDREFFRCLQAFSQGVGAGFNDLVCEFSSELAPEDEKYCGVKFYLFEDELLVSYPQFFHYLSMATGLFLSENSSMKALVDASLLQIKRKFDEIQNDV